MTINTINNVPIQIDASDYEKVKSIRWRIRPDGYIHGSYKQNGRWCDIILHRLIMGACDGVEVDHINHDKLDNRRGNLRLCNRAQNKANTPPICTNTSGYKGVSYHKGAWQASIRVTGKLLYLGRFPTREGAALAYNHKAFEVFGDYAYLNPISDLAST